MSTTVPIGAVVGGCRIERPLGKGGMGQVFLARQEGLDRPVALKLLAAQVDPELLLRFWREARATAALEHENVVKVVDMGRDPQLGPFIVYELVDGPNLEERCAKGPLPEREALGLLLGVARALAFAETKGVVHRDVKPENILIGADGVPRLADLGLARFVERGGDARLTATGSVLGTPYYMAPEQALGLDDLDGRADLYALGLCLWRALAGEVPFFVPGQAALMILTRRIEEDLPDVRTRAPGTSEATVRLLAGLTARERDDRYRTAAAALDDFQRVLAGEPPVGPAAKDPPRPRASSRRAAAVPGPSPRRSSRRAAAPVVAPTRAEGIAEAARAEAARAEAAEAERAEAERAEADEGAVPWLAVAVVAGLLATLLGAGLVFATRRPPPVAPAPVAQTVAPSTEPCPEEERLAREQEERERAAARERAERLAALEAQNRDTAEAEAEAERRGRAQEEVARLEREVAEARAREAEEQAREAEEQERAAALARARPEVDDDLRARRLEALHALRRALFADVPVAAAGFEATRALLLGEPFAEPLARGAYARALTLAKLSLGAAMEPRGAESEALWTAVQPSREDALLEGPEGELTLDLRERLKGLLELLIRTLLTPPGEVDALLRELEPRPDVELTGASIYYLSLGRAADAWSDLSDGERREALRGLAPRGRMGTSLAARLLGESLEGCASLARTLGETSSGPEALFRAALELGGVEARAAIFQGRLDALAPGQALDDRWVRGLLLRAPAAGASPALTLIDAGATAVTLQVSAEGVVCEGRSAPGDLSGQWVLLEVGREGLRGRWFDATGRTRALGPLAPRLRSPVRIVSAPRVGPDGLTLFPALAPPGR